MSDRADTSNFDKSRAELFDALGHPIRIRILHALESGPLGFSELRRRVGLESSGHLQFHLGKLDGLIQSSASGAYDLTDDGREALRIMATGEQGISEGHHKDRMSGKVSLSRAALAAVIAAFVLIASVAIVQQYQISSQQRQIGSLEHEVASQTAEVENLTSTVSSLYDQLHSIEESNSSALQVIAALVATPPSQGRNLSVTIYAAVYNSLSTFNVLTAQSTANPALGPCQQQVATTVNVYAGYYSKYNVSYARPLLLYNPTWQYACPAFGTFQYIFLPASDMAAIGEGHAELSFTQTVNESVSLSGYWTGSGETLTFQSFQAGIYTVGVSDVWGSTTLVYFTAL